MTPQAITKNVAKTNENFCSSPVGQASSSMYLSSSYSQLLGASVDDCFAPADALVVVLLLELALGPAPLPIGSRGSGRLLPDYCCSEAPGWHVAAAQQWGVLAASCQTLW
eukprot:CAMPEP_0206424520 /NCGR_PEP_ID=MMETSP0324_2-20121206/3276_1 /ASSEMBLY_ACC=CAM_ASM_000836 /TAXON_ID=2866 /ORGANISM="Crypthecodinium cohnii, Strain Seligo" /LENGTH=109 /DNA_ID=CAMNT_0053889189 /DNA_START=842 /DNA_END=1172 /DNA_ORIENTATION=-